MRSRSWGRMPIPPSSTVSRTEAASWTRPTRMDAGRAALASAALRIRLASHDARERGEVVERVGSGRRMAMAGRGLPPIEQAEAQAGELEREALAAAPLPPLRGRRRGSGPDRSDHPEPVRAALTSHPAAALHDADVPAPQGGVDVQLGGVVRGGGVARGLWLELGSGRNFPHGDGAAPERDTRLAQDLASAFDERLPLRHRAPRTPNPWWPTALTAAAHKNTLNRGGAPYICDKPPGPSSNRAA